jgi:hypothetical protein
MKIISILIIFFFISCYTPPHSGKRECKETKQLIAINLILSNSPAISDSKKQGFHDAAIISLLVTPRFCSKENTRN